MPASDFKEENRMIRCYKAGLGLMVGTLVLSAPQSSDGRGGARGGR